MCQYDTLEKLTWYDFDDKPNKKIRKVLILTPEIRNILGDVWDRGVFYINSLIDYGNPLCKKAIKDAMQLDPPELINYRTLRAYLRRERRKVTPTQTQKMLDLTRMCQVKYGSFLSDDSEPLPWDLRFVAKNQLPLKSPSRIYSSTRERFDIMINDYNYIRQSLLKVRTATRAALANDSTEDLSETVKLNDEVVEEHKGTCTSFLDYDDHTIQCDHRSDNRWKRIESFKRPKNRLWEKRQRGYRAAWLRIDNVARVQKSRVRRALESSMNWQDLSPSEQRKRENSAFSKIENERQKKKEKAKALYLEAANAAIECKQLVVK